MNAMDLESAEMLIGEYMYGGAQQKQEVLDFLTKKTDEFTLNGHDGTVVTVTGRDIAFTPFVYALARYYIEHSDKPLDMIDIIVACANSLPDQDSRNVEVVRELENYFRKKYVRGENRSRDYFFLQKEFLVVMGNRKMTSRGSAIRSVFDGMGSTSANDWLHQEFGSLELIYQILSGDFNADLSAIGMTQEDISSSIIELARVIKEHNDCLMECCLYSEQSPKWNEENKKVLVKAIEVDLQQETEKD